MQTLVKAAMQNLNIDASQATQFILKFGLYPDRLEGQIIKSLDATLEQFAGEVVKSAKFFQSRYPNIPISSVVLSGFALSIPAFGEYLATKTGLATAAGNAWSNVHFGNDVRDTLTQLAPQFGVVVGLAERTV
jgi:type IV pilus assembly protein PilM/plasmid segregation protein ParM